MRALRTLAFLLVATAVLATPAGAFGFADFSFPDAALNEPYSFQLEARNGTSPYSFRFSSGNFVPGLRVQPDGKITGRPAGAGLYRFYLEALDAVGAKSQREYTINVTRPVTITTGTLPPGSIGVPYYASLKLAYGGGSWTLTGGAAPPGLNVASDGTISGVPTDAGTYAFSVRVSADGKTATKGCAITIAKRLAVAAPQPFAAVAGSPMFGAVRPTGGFAPFTWRQITGELPLGVALSSMKGTITGIPAHPGRFSVGVVVRDAFGTEVRADVQIVVSDRLALESANLLPGRVRKRYRAQILATGGFQPLHYTLAGGALPPGLRFDTASGGIRGTPTTPGLFQFAVRVNDTLGGYRLAAFLVRIKP